MPYKSLDQKRKYNKLRNKLRREATSVVPEIEKVVPQEISCVVPEQMLSKYTITIPLFHTEQYKINHYQKLITGQFI
jgi:hypothetical protein